MSPNVGNLMYQLRELNYEKSIKPTLRKLNDILPERTGELIDSYSNLLVEHKSPEEVSNSNFYKNRFLETVDSKTYQNSNTMFSEIVKEGIEEMYAKK